MSQNCCDVPLMLDGVVSPSIFSDDQHRLDHFRLGLKHLHEFSCMVKTGAWLEYGILNANLRKSSIKPSIHAVGEFQGLAIPASPTIGHQSVTVVMTPPTLLSWYSA